MSSIKNFTTPSSHVNVMAKAALKASRSLVRDFGEVAHLQVSRKGPGDFVSAADYQAEKIIREELSYLRPGYSLLMEESGRVEGTDPTHCWIVDPLDGTTNFLHGLPHFSISIALQKNDEVIAGIVYDPLKDELFWAEKGMGTFLNDRRLRVSTRHDLTTCLLATGLPFAGYKADEFTRCTQDLQAIMPKVSGVRRFGSAALDLAYVAAGRFDGYWERGLSPWDIAAGILLVKEAGGSVSALNNTSEALHLQGTILASNANIHEDLLYHFK